MNRAWSVPLVGRTGPRAARRRWRTEAAEGRFRLVAVTGPPGIGKSRMLSWVADEHRRRHGVAWLGRCSPELSPSFAPVVAAMGPRWPALPDAPRDGSVHLAPEATVSSSPGGSWTG
jgi:predicted ATPase